jgi:phosphoglycolate phosphatase-like HAD superfamily hydrolase
MHIVWDWNGTLFDDRDAIVDATNEVFLAYGLPPMELDHYRRVYTRPLWVSYERVLGRALLDGEWERIDQAFHDAYHRLMERCRLAADAKRTIDTLADDGHTQSVLSMWRHDKLTLTARSASAWPSSGSTGCGRRRPAGRRRSSWRGTWRRWDTRPPTS